MRPIAALALATVLQVAPGVAAAQDAAYAWRLPPWLEPPAVPADNPMTGAKVALGRRLFYDVRLSGPSYLACASCHDPARSFSDGRARAIGVTGERLPRSAMALVNVAYLQRFNWSDPVTGSLEAQLRRPLFAEHPTEMGVKGFEATVLERLRHDPPYPRLFREAFPDDARDIGFDTIAKAIAAFERTLISAFSPYDRYLHGGEHDAISTAAKRGEALFRSERLKCASCHAGPHFTDATAAPRFHNTGLYNVDGRGAMPPDSPGLIAHTGRPEDMGRFRTPTLRNVALTAPYMHDGSLATLEAVIEHYAAGGEAARRGARSPLTSPLVPGFQIDAREKADLIAFLTSLTNDEFLRNPAHGSPFR